MHARQAASLVLQKVSRREAYQSGGREAIYFLTEHDCPSAEHLIPTFDLSCRG
jgi:hypothetical protein